MVISPTGDCKGVLDFGIGYCKIFEIMPRIQMRLRVADGEFKGMHLQQGLLNLYKYLELNKMEFLYHVS